MSDCETLTCAFCNNPISPTRGHINRALKFGRRLFCGRVCFGLDRRKHKTVDQKIEEKRLYDEQYRIKNKAKLKAYKAAAYKLNFDREKEAAYRKQHMARHVEYCRRPEYKAIKKEYDKEYRAKQDFGAFWEAAILVLQVDAEIASRATRYDIYMTNDTINKSLKRKRAYGNSIRNRT